MCFNLYKQPAEIFGGQFILMLQKSNFCGKEKETIMKPVYTTVSEKRGEI